MTPGARDPFFGRAEEASLLAEWWQANNLTYVVGPAGRGKTSLLGSGVLPLLTGKKIQLLPGGRFSAGVAFPVAALPGHNPYTLGLLHSWSADVRLTRLAGMTVSDFIGSLPGTGPVLAAIDSADDLPAHGPLPDRDRRAQLRDLFLAEIAEALRAHRRLHLLVAGRPQGIATIAHKLGNGLRYDLPALAWQQAAEAVSGLLTSSGRTLADGAMERLLTDLLTSKLGSGEDGDRYVTEDLVEPAILQVACAYLLDSLPKDLATVTTQHVRLYGDVDQALVKEVRSVVAEIADDHDMDPRRIGSWLRDTFVTELGTRNKAYEGPVQTARMPHSVARAMEDRYLLTASLQSGSRWYELLGDRLLAPVRQAARSEPEGDWVPGARFPDRLRTAERELTRGHIDVARKHAEEFERYARGTLCGSEGSATAARPQAYQLLGMAHSLLGNLAYEREKPHDAEEHYREAKQQYAAAEDSQSVGYQFAAVGQMLLEQGRTAEAVTEFEAAIARVPNDPVIRVAHARAMWQLGEGRAAVALLTSALGIDGGNPAALRARGEILADLGDAQEAIRDLDRVSRTGWPVTKAARGMALAMLGDRRGARREIEDALASAEHNGPVLLYTARALVLIGEAEAAEEHALRATQATDPPLSAPHRELARRLSGQATRA